MQFKIERKQRFFQLAVEGLLVGQEEVFGQLLCDRARAFLDASVLQIDERRACNRFGIEAVVRVEAATTASRSELGILSIVT